MEDRSDALVSLLEAYAAAEPNRSRGGISALTGFQFQLWSHLADYAGALVSGDAPAGGSSFAEAFEALSDYTRSDRNTTVCVQTKSHITAANMADAAAEFAVIERFLRGDRFQSLRGTVEYELVGRTGLTSLKWSAIQLPSAVLTKDPDLAPCFEQLRASGRLRTPRIEPDPRWRFIATVFEQIDDPFGFAQGAFDLCASRVHTAQSAAFIRDAIARMFKACRRREPLTSRVAAAADFTTNPAGRGVSLARTPTLSDLRECRFMDRPTRVQQALAAIDDLRHRDAELDEATMPVFWIDGRSGSGKSVLLLQIIERLVVDRTASVVWFANSHSEIGETVEQLARTPESLWPEYLCVDDLYDPQARDDVNLAQLTRRVVHSGPRKWPMLITCGPTEFWQDFERDCRAEGFSVTPWHLDPLEPQETDALRGWFQKRTGRVPEAGTAASEQQGLMISVMFEMTHGDLAPFAHRFRARLAEDGLDRALAVPLALNRLYIWTPKHWLTADEQAKLERLNQDGDFSILSLEGDHHALLRLTHPHLSDSLYRALYPGTIPVTLARHLVTAFRNALFTHLPTALRLMRAIAPNPDRLRIVDAEELACGMATVWNAWNTAALPRGMAAEMWMNWARWAARAPAVGAQLSVAPLDMAIESLGTDHPRWAPIWFNLFRCAPGESRLVKLAYEWLAANNDADGWASVWCTLTAQVVQRVDRQVDTNPGDTSVLFNMGWQWLKTHAEDVSWSWVCELILDNRFLLPNITSSAAVLEVVNTWVYSHAQSPAWSYVWSKAVDHCSRLEDEPCNRQALLDYATRWLSDHTKHSGWPDVWIKMLSISENGGSRLDRGLVIGWGVAWLKEQRDHQGWSYVWNGLINCENLAPASRTHFLSIAKAWYVGRENSPGWFHVLTSLENEGVISRDILFAWLDHNRESPRWAGRWLHCEKLRQRFLPEERRWLIDAAWNWLHSNPEHSKALEVLVRIVAMRQYLNQTELQSLINEAFKVLIRPDRWNDAMWAYLWFDLWNYVWDTKEQELLSELIMIGKSWISNPMHLSTATWDQVYIALLRQGCVRDQSFRELGYRAALSTGLANAEHILGSLLDDPAAEEPSDAVIGYWERWFRSRRKSGGFSRWRRLDASVRNALSRAASEQWEKLGHILKANEPLGVTRWQSIVHLYQDECPVVGQIEKLVSKKGGYGRQKRLGYVVDIGVNAYMPMEEASVTPLSPTERNSLVGQSVEVLITRLDEEKLQVDVSRRRLMEGAQKQALAALQPGVPVMGTVKSLQSYGVFVELGIGIALLHRSEIPGTLPADLSDAYPVGHQIEARILAVDLEHSRISLTLKGTPCQIS